MTRANAVDLAEILQVIEGNAVAEQVHKSILEHASMTVGQDETIPVRPLWVLRVELHKLVEKDMGSRS